MSIAQFRALTVRDRRPVTASNGHTRDYVGDFLSRAALRLLPPAEREHVGWHPTRQWRMDAAWPDLKIAVEYQGIYQKANASHSSISGQKRDYEKWTEAQLLGWIVILIDAASVDDKRAEMWVHRAFELRNGKSDSQN